MLFRLDHLWWEVVERPTESLASITRRVLRAIEVLSEEQICEVRRTTLQPKSPILSSPFSPTAEISDRRGQVCLPRTDEEVLRLDVPMYDVFSVQVAQGVCHLRNVLRVAHQRFSKHELPS